MKRRVVRLNSRPGQTDASSLFLFLSDMALTDKANVERVMQGLSPQARAALKVMSEMQNRPAEDVLRDEIRNYIAGRLPALDIEGAVRAIADRAYQAGYIVGSLRRFARNWNRD